MIYALCLMLAVWGQILGAHLPRILVNAPRKANANGTRGASFTTHSLFPFGRLALLVYSLSYMRKIIMRLLQKLREFTTVAATIHSLN